MKAPESKRLNQRHDGPLSNSAFNINLRRYNLDQAIDDDDALAVSPVLKKKLSPTASFYGGLSNVQAGKPAPNMDRQKSQQLKVDPADGAKFARGSNADDDNVIDLDWEAEVYRERLGLPDAARYVIG